MQERGAPGRIVVRTGRNGGTQAWIEVEDDGPGLPPEHISHLGEPYFTTRAREGGLGLGLFVTRGIVDGLGGQLEFDSVPDRGVRARVILPALPTDAAVTLEPPAPTLEVETIGADASPAESVPATPVRLRLLIVDDEPTVLSMLSRVFANEWDVDGAPDGASALVRLATARYDAVLCDLMMPGVSGIELAEEVSRRWPELRSRMVFLTGGAVTPAAQAFVERADVHCLMKPVRLPELREALHAVTNHGPAR
jgi:CheY-like chemotaxis protein